MQTTGEVSAGPEHLLTETLFAVYEFLTEAESLSADQNVAIDLVVEEFEDPVVAATSEAFIEAVRGTMQSWVLERGSASAPANLVISTQTESGARDMTLQYLLGANGGFSRGSTTDLREAS